MTTEQFLTMLMMPVGGLMIGVFMLYITRKDRVEARKAAKGRH